MKEVILVFAMLLLTASSVELMPILSAPQVNFRSIREGSEVDPLEGLPKHNLNRGQLKKMDWLKHLSR